MKPSYDVEIGKVTYNGTEIPLKSGGTPSGEWQPNEDMKWAKQVCENDVQEGFTYKVLQMISDGYVYTDIVVPSGGAVKTSDGGYYTANAKHTWDDTNARVATSHTNMKLRWLIYYYTSETPSITLLSDVMYACFDGVKFGTIFSSKYILEYFDIINGADLSSSVTNMREMFYFCYSLHTIPLLDTSSVTNMSSVFQACYSLQTIPLLNTSNVTNMSSMFRNCYSLQTVPLLNTSSVTNMSSMFQYCNSLQTMPLLDTSKVTNMLRIFSNCSSLQTIPLLDASSATTTNGMFEFCSSLQTIPLLDISSVTDMSYMFQRCSYLEFLTMTNIKVSFKISDSTKFSQETLEALIDNLVDLTGQTAQTFTMGSTNLEKVSQVKKDLATAKNWNLN